MSLFGKHSCDSPESTFAIGHRIGAALEGGELILLEGGLGAGKTLLTKGILEALDFDVDEVTSPSFTLVNLYRTPRFDVFHLDLWRIEPPADPVAAVGLEEILEDEKAVVIVEWSERLSAIPAGSKIIRVAITGDGDDPRTIEIEALS
jgi:tRNA threonylcarbamoyladenosine biosynthesis protein TsaE